MAPVPPPRGVLLGFAGVPGRAQRFTTIHWWNEPPKGGHFAAFEQPVLFVDEVRSSFVRCDERATRAFAPRKPIR